MKTIKFGPLVLAIETLNNSLLSKTIDAYICEENPTYFLYVQKVDHLDMIFDQPKLVSKNQSLHHIGENIILTGYRTDRPVYQIIFNQKNNRYDFKLLKTDNFDLFDLEYVLTAKVISDLLIKHDDLMVHASAISVFNECIMFLGPSGVGKSTLANKWIKHQTDAFMINDDKPIIKHKHKKTMCYSSPWAGSLAIQRNVEKPIKAIIFLEQSDTNEIVLLNNQQKVVKFLENTQKYLFVNQVDLVLEKVDFFIKHIPMYLYKCQDNDEAFEVLFDFLYKV